MPTKATVVDPTTHELRKPTAAELDELMVTLKPLTQDPTAGPASVTRPDGSTSLLLDGSLDTVLLARPNADGTFETRCVSTFAEAVQFLGLEPVPADSPAAKKFLRGKRNVSEE